MKCNVCGAYNKPEYKKCIRCGNPLLSPEQEKKREKVLIEHQSPLKNTPTFREAVIIESKDEPEVEKDIKPGTHKKTTEDVDLWTGKAKKKPIYERRKPTHVLSIKDESEIKTEQHKHPRRKTSAPPKGSNLEKISKLREGQEVEVLIPPETEKKREKAPRKKSGLKWGRIILVSATAGIVIIGLIVGFFYLFRGMFSGMGTLFSGHEELPNGGQPMVERVFINGQTWHRITFYGEDGERVLVEDPIRSLSIQDNHAELLLDDLSFVPEEDTQDESMEYVTVDLQASLFSTDGEETPLDVPAYNIPVDPSPLKLVYPTEPDLEVDYTQVLVKIKVTPGSRVLIDNVNLTDVVDSSGYVQKYVNLEEGLNEIEILVETYKHRRTVEYVYVSRPELDVMLELDAPESQFYEGEMWISGYTEPDTTVYIDTYRTAADVSYETDIITAADGSETEVRRFKFRYVLSSYGWNEIEMEAVTPDGRTATLTHRVERVPDHRSYTRKAWPMDYPYLSQSTEALIGQVFQCKGTVIRREDTDTSRMYLFNVGTESEPQYIMIEYTGSQSFKVGERYVVYADVIGTYNNYALLAGRFIYDWEDIEPAEVSEIEQEDP